ATPLALELPRGDAPVELALRLEGHREHVESIVPDVEQRVRLTLARDRRRGGGGGTRPTKSAPAGNGEGGGFFRFE
ncbi:MAG: hypothetical protein M3Y87_26515, partial [Myxococcota bacterium]|nr:hypothetical protein [Myxococcota bacterium]